MSNFSCTELNTTHNVPIWVYPNNKISSRVDLDVELNKSDSIYFHDVQWCTMLTSLFIL